jgi:hypothetical protein
MDYCNNSNSFNYCDAEESISMFNKKTKIILTNDFKELVYEQMELAQNTHGMFYLSKLSTYDIFHEELKRFFIKHYDKIPNQCDNLSFVLLLTYPKYIIETPPEPIPSGKILLQLVQEGELQIIDFGRQICVQNTGAFFPAKAPNNPRGTELPSGYSISGKGIDRDTTVIGYNYGPSTPLGIYKDCLILTLSKPINILLADGNFYVPPPPNTPAPPTEKPGETPGPPTPGPTPYSILNPRNVPTSAALITQPPGSSNFVIAVFEAIALFFANLFKR